MFYYKLRIDTCNEKLCHELVDKYSKDTYLWCSEKVGTPDQHAHFYLETDVSNPTIRAYIRKHFGTGNGVYSLKALKEPKPIEYLAYLTKDGRYFDKNLELDEALAYDDEMKKRLKDKKTTSKRSVFAVLCDDYLSSTAYQRVLATLNWQELAAYVIDWHLQHDKQLSRFRIEGYVQTLACKYHDYTPFFAHKIVEHM